MKFIEVHGEEKCYNCELVGVDNPATVYCVEEDNDISTPLCTECKEIYIIFIEENGTEERLSESTDS